VLKEHQFIIFVSDGNAPGEDDGPVVELNYPWHTWSCLLVHPSLIYTPLGPGTTGETSTGNT
jgi:hypothetical protein